MLAFRFDVHTQTRGAKTFGNHRVIGMNRYKSEKIQTLHFFQSISSVLFSPPCEDAIVSLFALSFSHL